MCSENGCFLFHDVWDQNWDDLNGRKSEQPGLENLLSSWLLHL